MSGEDPLVGQEIGGYRVLSRLATGGMGTVYRAQHTRLEKLVALKVLSPSMKEVEEYVARFHREARLAAQLEHPNIVRIYDFGQEGDVLYLVMQLVEGESLAERLERTPKMPFREVLRVVRGTLRALAAAHRNGLIHRDIKPDNILLSNRGEVLLSDFGCVKRFDDEDDTNLVSLDTGGMGGELTVGGAILGTPLFMSPEQCTGLPDIDTRADLYSVGVLFYLMLTGHNPHAGETALEIMQARILEDPKPPSVHLKGFPPHLDALLLKLLAREPDDRFASAPALLKALARAVAPRPRGGRPPARGRGPQRRPGARGPQRPRRARSGPAPRPGMAARRRARPGGPARPGVAGRPGAPGRVRPGGRPMRVRPGVRGRPRVLGPGQRPARGRPGGRRPGARRPGARRPGGRPIPEQPTPEQPTPEQPTSEQPMSGVVTPEQATPEVGAPEQPTAEVGAPEQAASITSSSEAPTAKLPAPLPEDLPEAPLPVPDLPVSEPEGAVGAFAGDEAGEVVGDYAEPEVVFGEGEGWVEGGSESGWVGDAEEEWEDEGSDSWAADDFAAGQSLWGQDVWGGDEWTDPEWSAEEDPQPEEGEEGDEGDDWGGGDDWGSGADWGDHPWSDLAEGEGDAFEAEEDVLEEAVEAPVEAPVEVAGSGQVVPPERARFGSDRETYKLTDVEIQIPDLAELEGGSDEGRALVAEVESGQTREADAYRPTLREVLQDVLKDPNAFETMHVNQDALILQPYDKDAPPDPEAPPQLDCEVCFLTRAEGRPLTVGRHADSTVILDHGSISRVHAILGFMNDGWKIMDRSSNGCFMGEQRLPKERPIHFPYHARVRLGRAMVLHLSSPALLREFAAHVDL